MGKPLDQVLGGAGNMWGWKDYIDFASPMYQAWFTLSRGVNRAHDEQLSFRKGYVKIKSVGWRDPGK